MSRKRSNSVFENLMELVAALPWWLGVGFAIAAYALLSSFAASPQAPQNIRPGDAVARALAAVGQYFVPLVCMLGAALSAWRRAQRRRLAREATRNPGADAIEGMSWKEFEILVGEAFRLGGYRVAETGGGGADGGIDLKLTKHGETFFVQCKQWRAFKVGINVVRELYGVMAASGAAGGFVVTSGRFTDEAKSFAKGRNVTLVDGDRLRVMLERVRSGMERADSGKPSASQTSLAIEAPQCPSCGATMTLRTAMRGRNSGGKFWGCTTYPACRGTREVSQTSKNAAEVIQG